MTPQETLDLLQRRRLTCRIDYSPATVEAWSNSLNDIPLIDALRAMDTLTAAGDMNITVPAIRGVLRSEHRRDLIDTPPPARDHGCTCDMSRMCDMHRHIGLDGIAKIRAQLGEKPKDNR